jgi:hypothetical protein
MQMRFIARRNTERWHINFEKVSIGKPLARCRQNLVPCQKKGTPVFVALRVEPG